MVTLTAKTRNGHYVYEHYDRGELIDRPRVYNPNDGFDGYLKDRGMESYIEKCLPFTVEVVASNGIKYDREIKKTYKRKMLWKKLTFSK